MRREDQQNLCTIHDVQDQPDTKYFLFVDIGGVSSVFRVDGVRWGIGGVDDYTSIGLEAYREGVVTASDGGELRTTTSVVLFPSETKWTLVASEYIDVASKGSVWGQTLEVLPEKIKLGLRYNRILKQFEEEAQQSINFDATMRRMWGQSGEEPL